LSNTNQKIREFLKENYQNVVSPDPTIRKITLSSFINTFGNGVFMTTGIIYFSLVVGLGAQKVALAFSLSGALALILRIPSGHFADRYTPLLIAFVSLIGSGFCSIALLFVQSWWPLFLVLSMWEIFDVFGQNARMALIARIGVGEERVRIRAYTRAVTNLGIAFGTVVAGFALAINTVSAYKTMIAIDALTFFVAAITYLRVPNVPPSLSEHESFDWTILRDTQYIKAATLHGIMTMHFVLQNIAIPLWIVQETNAPRWWVSVIMFVNTVAIVLFQVRMSKGTVSAQIGAAQFRKAGFYIALACLMYGSAKGLSAPMAATLLILAMIVHVVGELLSSTGGWSIAFELADQNRQGAYQGLWRMGFGGMGVIGPSLVTFFAIGLGQLGWLIMAGIFAATGLLMSTATKAKK
jgi:MFS family permease